MVWTLPGRVNDPVLQKKAILETSYGFSRTFNPRNIEFSWYPLWGQILSDLVADVPHLIVYPQFPVWVVHEDVDEDQDDGDDPEEVEEVVMDDQPEGEQDDTSLNDDDDDVEGVGTGNISFSSTIAVKDARGVVVDFAILSLTVVPEAEQKDRYGGWRITTASVGLLVEVKRFASRSLKGEELDLMILAQVEEAREDLVEQAGYLFLQDEKNTSVKCIAAAGPYWSGTTIYRTDIGGTIHRISAKDPDYRPSGKKTDRKPRWTKILRVDCAPSMARLYTLYTKLENLEDA